MNILKRRKEEKKPVNKEYNLGFAEGLADGKAHADMLQDYDRELRHFEDWMFSHLQEELKGSKSLTQQYNKEIQKVDRISSYYSFEFAKMPET